MIESTSGRLLIVDDDIESLTPLCELLSENGYLVAGYTSGKDALETLKKQDFDLLLTDLIMPEMNGIALLQAALKIDPHLVGIIITGQGTIQTAVEAMKVGAFDYVLKPFQFKILRQILSRAMEVRRLRINNLKLLEDITEGKQVEEELKSSREQLRNLSAHLQSIMEKERMNIAREIHDELGQALTVLKMDLFWLNNQLPKDQKLLFEKTKSMSELIDKTVKTVQRISAELRPGLLDDLGLAAAIEWQAEEFQKRTGIKCEVILDPVDIILDQDISTAVFRIFQEALMNVFRHANATNVEVSLDEKADKILLKVKDNGKGITEKQISNPESFGLIGIRERVHLLGGYVKIIGIRDKGTTITVTIPLNKNGKTL